MESNQSLVPANETLKDPFTLTEKVLIILGLSSLSLITIIGNVLVIVSIKVNKHLQMVNNYFLFSLACADLIIGLFSMNLYTAFIVTGHWPLGPVVCDLWLALDYVASNASVMNLLIISFDRYFCVTKPLTYPIKRTTKMAGLMIAAAWILSFILWAPAILFWQFITGKQNVENQKCLIQFFSNPVVTFGTAIAAFYLPVVIMSVLYWKISKASRRRIRTRASRKDCGTNQESRIQSASVSEGNKEVRKQALEDGVSRGQRSASDATTGEDRESENDSSSGSALASSNQRDEASLETNGDVPKAPTKPSSPAKAGWAKLTCFKTQSEKSADDGYKPSSASPKSSQCKERQSLAALILKPPHKKKRSRVGSRERKMTRTIMAILMAFVATWTPYNVMVLINTFCDTCIPNSMWVIGYWLCYINSTVNPACYALCNVTFKNTFKQLLMCNYKHIRMTR